MLRRGFYTFKYAADAEAGRFAPGRIVLERSHKSSNISQRGNHEIRSPISMLYSTYSVPEGMNRLAPASETISTIRIFISSANSRNSAQSVVVR